MENNIHARLVDGTDEVGAWDGDGEGRAEAKEKLCLLYNFA